jgi:serine/threonine protein kinase
MEKKHGRIDRWVHADIKPQNLYIDRYAAKTAPERTSDSVTPFTNSVTPFTKIGDLGLTCKTGSLSPGGTEDYMPREQENLGIISTATDLFAVGQTVAFMVLGRPFTKEELKHVNRMERNLTKRIPSVYVAKKLTKIVRKMTNATPGSRGSPDESIRLLSNVLNSSIEWKILAIFMSLPPTGLTLADAADILFDELKSTMGWGHRTPERLNDLKHIVRSMYKRKIFFLRGHKYGVLGRPRIEGPA